MDNNIWHNSATERACAMFGIWSPPRPSNASKQKEWAHPSTVAISSLKCTPQQISHSNITLIAAAVVASEIAVVEISDDRFIVGNITGTGDRRQLGDYRHQRQLRQHSCAGARGLGRWCFRFPTLMTTVGGLNSRAWSWFIGSAFVLFVFRFRTMWCTFCASPDPNPVSSNYQFLPT